jgi:hypothetical protein
MCAARNIPTKPSTPSLLAAAITATVLVLGAREAPAHLSPVGCNGNTLMVSISKDRNNIVSGTVVTYTITVENPAKVGTIIGCDITLGTNGLLFHCPAADGTTNGTMTTLIPANAPLPAGFGPATFTVQCTVVLNAGVQSAVAAVDAPGALLHDNSLRDDTADINKALSVNVFTPCITVTKRCDGAPFAFGQPIKFSGSVSNCGDILLANVRVVDSVVGVVLGPTNTLAPGAVVSFSGSYNPTGNLCGPFTDTVTATGTAPLDNPVTVTATASATCPVISSPAIKVTKSCDASIEFGTTNVNVSGDVSNTGNVPLTGVKVVDSDGTTLIGPIDLAVGGSAHYTGTITVPVGSGPFTDTATATGTDICAQQPVTATASCTSTVLQQPQLSLIKTANPANPKLGQPVTYYFAVTNTGNVTITNINILDDNGTPGDTSDDFLVNPAPFSLDPGQGTVFAITHIAEPLCMSNGGTNLLVGTLTLNVLTNGDVAVQFMQSQGIVDNRYGTNATAATGWPGGHKFNDLLGSDAAEFQFTDGNNKVVLDFLADYISQATSAKFGDGITISYPSGYGTLGELGGDGKMISGSASNVLSVHTTISDTLNQSSTFYGFTVNSPPETSPLSGISKPPGWNYVDGYYVLVSHNAFGAAGFGGMTIPYIHDSPSKLPFIKFLPTNVCECVENTAGATAFQGTELIASSFDQATVCFGPPPPCVILGACTPPYPFSSTNPLTSIAFNESGILRTSVVYVATATTNCVADHISLFYNDEHAMALGIRQVTVKTTTETNITTYPLSPLLTNPGAVTNPLVGSTIPSGDQAGVDSSGRPLFPALFITDLTTNPNSLGGDWQYGGTAIPPTEVYGTWKGAVKTVDQTKSPPTVTLTMDADPATKNNWLLGPGSDPVPNGLSNEGYGAEARWDVSKLGLVSGHTYRLYFMIHDGDQNKTGGDAGQACATIVVP